jgi:hypothetical protein
VLVLLLSCCLLALAAMLLVVVQGVKNAAAPALKQVQEQTKHFPT